MKNSAIRLSLFIPAHFAQVTPRVHRGGWWWFKPSPHYYSRLFSAPVTSRVNRIRETSEDTRIKRRKPKWVTSYSNMTIEETEMRLRVQIDEIKAVPVETMIADSKPILERAGIDKKAIDVIKEAVYAHILQYLNIEGYPTEWSSDFREANVSDLVLYTIGPVLDAMKEIRRKIRLKREKEIIAPDGLTGGMEEFVVIDRVAIAEHKYVLIIEAKRAAMGQAMAQILLAMKDARGSNARGVVYGFVTTGDDWRMLSYDGREFVQTEKFTMMFDTMRERKERWMTENSVVVDCLVVALANGGIVQKNVVVFQ